jgi:hypothetical protein
MMLRQKRERWSNNKSQLAKSSCHGYKPVSQKRNHGLKTKEDLRTLKTMAKENRGATKIAKVLKRTVGATRAMAVKRRVSLSTR